MNAPNTHRITAPATLAALAVVTSLNAEPTLWFGDSGAPFFVLSDPDPVQMIPLDDGNRVLLLWQQTHHITRIQSIIGITYDRDGNPETEEPVFYTDPDDHINLISSRIENQTLQHIIDPNSNIFFITFREVDSTLVVQKLSASGERRWGEWGVEIRDFIPRGSYNYVEQIISDHFGGCYIRTWRGILALNEDGEFRDEWQWHHADPAGDLFTGTLYPDGAGGFWYYLMDIESEDIMGWNKLDYQGRHLLQGRQGAPWRFGNAREYTGFWPAAGLGGPMEIIFKRRVGEIDSIGFFRIDNSGNRMGDQFMHLFPVERGEFFTPRFAFPLSESRLIFRYGPAKATLYDAVNNTTPWGIRGVDFGLNLITINYIELQGGRILFVGQHENIANPEYYRNVLRTVEPDGEVIESQDIHGNFTLSAITAGNDDFYILKRATRGQRIEMARYYLDQHAASGDNVWNERVHLPIKTRSAVGSNYGRAHIWAEENGLLHVIFPQREVGHTLMTLDPWGEIVGSEWGRVIEPVDSFEFDGASLGLRSIAKTLTDRILYGWTGDSYRMYSDSLFIPKLISLTPSGEVEWSAHLSQRLEGPFWNWSPIQLAVDSDERRVVALTAKNANQGGQFGGVDLILSGIDVESGEILWRSELLSYLRGYEDSRQFLCGSLDAIYLVTWENRDSLRIRKYDFDGNIVWPQDIVQRRTLGDMKVLNATASSDGSLWICEGRPAYQGRPAAVWLRGFDSDGDLVHDSIPLYTGRLPVWGNQGYREYKMIAKDDRIWVYYDFAYQLIDSHFVGLHCLTLDGELLTGGNGWIPERGPWEQRSWKWDFSGVPDGEGGLWYLWTFRERLENPDLPYLHSIRAMHFNENATPYRGYDRDGFYVIPREVALSQYRLYSPTLISGRRLAIQHGDVLQILAEYGPDRTPAIENQLPRSPAILALYPQPFNGRLNVTVRHGSTFSCGVLRIYDLLGREVMARSVKGSAGATSNLSLDLSTTPTGLYAVQYEEGEHRELKKIALLK